MVMHMSSWMFLCSPIKSLVFHESSAYRYVVIGTIHFYLENSCLTIIIAREKHSGTGDTIRTG